MAEHDVVCFHCGQSIGDPPVINQIDGEPCPACAERLLETLPGIFHTPFETVAEAQEHAQVEPGEGYESYEGPDVESV